MATVCRASKETDAIGNATTPSEIAGKTYLTRRMGSPAELKKD